VAVEKVRFSEKSQISGDRKCLGDWEKSLIELPDAKQFLRNRSERVFQQLPLFSTPIRKTSPVYDQAFISTDKGGATAVICSHATEGGK
jgi:hypothetical protein